MITLLTCVHTEAKAMGKPWPSLFTITSYEEQLHRILSLIEIAKHLKANVPTFTRLYLTVPGRWYAWKKHGLDTSSLEYIITKRSVVSIDPASDILQGLVLLNTGSTSMCVFPHYVAFETYIYGLEAHTVLVNPNAIAAAITAPPLTRLETLLEEET